jgi:Bacterial CdiA-CT RNAse A domain
MVGFKDVQTHGVVRGVMQDKNQKIEWQDGVQPLGEFVEQGFQIALLRNGFTHHKKRFKLTARLFEARSVRGNDRSVLPIQHEIQNSTRFAGLTTTGGSGRTEWVMRILFARRSIEDCPEEENVKGNRGRVGMRSWAKRVASALVLLQLAACRGAPGPGSPASYTEESKRASVPAPAVGGERYDLARDEQRGGHTLEKHVGRTDRQLEERLRRERHISAASTWTDLETAELTVAEALRAERGRVESWERRGYPRANLALHYNAGRAIGRCLERGADQAVDCSSAVMVLRADGVDRFYVLTTYPEARE